MQHKTTVGLLVIILIAVIFLALPADRAVSQELQSVLVTNFPQLQQVRGVVSIEGTIRHAALRTLKEIAVSPAAPEETTRLTEGGFIETEGFTDVVLSLNGRARGRIIEPGVVGAILVPEVESVTRAFEEEGQFQFPLEVAADLTPGASRSIASQPVRLPLAFPRYRVLLYNTSDTTIAVNLFAYVTH